MKSSVGIDGGKIRGNVFCGYEYANVSHVLWECSAYSSTRACFMKKFKSC